MKYIISFLVSIIMFTSLVFSQENNVEPLSISYSSGQGALSCGPVLSANFSNNDDLISFTLGERDIYFIYMKNIWKEIYSGPSIEYYHNIPTVGLMTNTNIYSTDNLSISCLNWVGFSAGDPDYKADFNDIGLLYFFQSLNVSYERFSLTGAALWYEEWGYLFEVKYKQPLTKHISAYTTAGYNFYQDGNYLFSYGLSYTF